MISIECLGVLNNQVLCLTITIILFAVQSWKFGVWKLDAPLLMQLKSRNMSCLELLVAPDTAVPPSHYPGLGHLDAKSDYCQCIRLIKKGKENCTKHTPSDEAT